MNYEIDGNSQIPDNITCYDQQEHNYMQVWMLQILVAHPIVKTFTTMFYINDSWHDRF